MKSFTIFKVTRLVFFILISTLSFNLFSQVLRPSFKQIELLTYDLNSPRTEIKDQIIIQKYVKINENGKMVVVEKNEKQQSKYYSYQLSNEEIGILNKVFNSQKELNKLIKNRKLDSNVFYAGYYEFLTYIDLNNRTDKISFIESDNLKGIKEALAIINSKSNTFENKQIVKEQEFEIDKHFIDEAFENHLKTKRLPSIALPPPQMN
jgi:hypothetical protein